MSTRDEILIDLVKEVLGPRDGSYEILPADQEPRDEYITGVLAPANAPRPPDDIEADIDEVIEETSSEEDQDTQGYVVVPGVFSPALDPKSLPRSIGLSFTVETDGGTPEIEICATWARYRLEQQGWQRQPAGFLTGSVQANQNHVSWQAADGVSLQLRSRSLPSGEWRVSLFLVNTTEVRAEEKLSTSHHLFQPQIRVYCCPGTLLVSVRTDGNSNLSDGNLGSLAAEDDSLNLLYRDRTALARGHLCGAMWKEIDPERPHPTLPSPNEAPFAWTDAVVVPEEEREKFSLAHARTELVPCYPVEVPMMEWDSQYEQRPILEPEVLAETWQPQQIRFSLQPLVDGYRRWIDERRQSEMPSLPQEQQTVAQAHLQQCQVAAERIQRAIEILANDEDVRLAFCFANKAIALQSRWNNEARGQSGRVLVWRPFQLAFILLNIPSLADPLHSERQICDLLWFPTGGGKTESYLGLAAFTLALRRLHARNNLHDDRRGAGVGVISRYTLRLLTIQQFRRAMGVITACDVLRVQGLDSAGTAVGWRPKKCSNQETFLWGGIRFSAGLWVGGGVTPNSQLSIGPIPSPSGGMTFIAGGLDILQGASRDYNGPNQTLRRNLNSHDLKIEGEPAQVLTCPCCQAVLAVPDEGLSGGRQHTLHFLFRGGQTTNLPLAQLRFNSQMTIDAAPLTPNLVAGNCTLSIAFSLREGATLRARQVDEWWYQTIAPALGPNANLLAARPARPGYFILTYENRRNNTNPCDFEIYCPNPRCELNQHAWAEMVPLSRTTQTMPLSNENPLLDLMATGQTAELPDVPGMQWQAIPENFRCGQTAWISSRIPISACTVDDQVYHRCPSLVIATVDKFARLAFEAKAASLFGNVNHYHSRWGYYREGCPPNWGDLPRTYSPHPPGLSNNNSLRVSVSPFLPPDLILQDELHLIEGPLGSMVGLYETAIELLCQRQEGEQIVRPKYVASTATIRQADSQVQALFNRQLALFPPSAISADDRFFACNPQRDVHPLEFERPGRLYVAVCAPGKGAQTPIVRIWSALLQSAYEHSQINPTLVDPFYTLVGYFNAVRELAGALSLYRQDIPDRIRFRAPTDPRQIEETRKLELSSRASSLDLPSLLERLKDQVPNAQDAVFATSMFGTGVDVDRLGLMVVHGQPKTTASYIQATGRVGRQGGGLVVTFFRASRPRDLDHYEFFTGYHRALYRHVEPITVAPFSPRARERSLGPLSVILLRHSPDLNNQQVIQDWRIQQRLSGAYYAEARLMQANRYAPEVTVIPELLEARANLQPDGRRPPNGVTATEAASELDRWRNVAAGQNSNADRFVYYEPAMLRPPERHVVLGDAQHRSQNFQQVYENAPQSLRDIEETTGFKT